MSTPSTAQGPPPPHPLLPGASPAAVRAHLLPEDQTAFVEAYGAALDEARRTLELGPVHDLVEDWRRVALVQSDLVRFRETVHRAAGFFTGRSVPADEPLEVTRTKARM